MTHMMKVLEIFLGHVDHDPCVVVMHWHMPSFIYQMSSETGPCSLTSPFPFGPAERCLYIIFVLPLR